MSPDASQRPIYPGGSWRWTVVLLFVAAIGLRLHGAWVAPPLSGFDGPYHAAYIGILAFEDRMPLPNEGWSTDHPPLYYAVSSLLWKSMPDRASAHTILVALRGLNVLAALGLGLAILASARLLSPTRPQRAVAAVAVALFVPMLVPASFLLGNEILAAALCAAALLVLLRCLSVGASLRWAALLGAVLGLGVLTKASVLILVAVALPILWARSRAEGGALRAGLAPVVVATLVFLTVCGWWFARNIVYTGELLITQNAAETREMGKQGYGPKRDPGAYVTLRPDALLDPADHSPRATAAVWPVTFASIWFDYHGTTLDVRRPAARRLAWLLYAFGLGWTVLAGLGIAAVVRRADGFRLPGAGAALLLLLGLTLASYVLFTWRVATSSALKGSYLSPGLPAFALLAGWGFDRVARAGRRARLAMAAALIAFVATVSAVFWVGWAPLPIDPASAYLLVYRDAPTDRVAAFFLGGR